MVLVVSLPAVTSCTKKEPKSTSDMGCHRTRCRGCTEARSARAASWRRRLANPMAYMAMAATGSSRPSRISGSWPEVLISDHWWIWGQSSSGMPTSSPTTCEGRPEVTSWTNSTSPSPTRSKIRRQMDRTRSSRPAITFALKLGANGRRKSTWRGGSMARSILRICSSRSMPKSSTTMPPSLAENSRGCAGDLDHVGVLEHRPEAGLAGHVLPVHGVRAAQLGEPLVRGPFEERVGGVEVGVVISFTPIEQLLGGPLGRHRPWTSVMRSSRGWMAPWSRSSVIPRSSSASGVMISMPLAIPTSRRSSECPASNSIEPMSWMTSTLKICMARYHWRCRTSVPVRCWYPAPRTRRR